RDTETEAQRRNSRLFKRNLNSLDILAEFHSQPNRAAILETPQQPSLLAFVLGDRGDRAIYQGLYGIERNAAASEIRPHRLAVSRAFPGRTGTPQAPSAATLRPPPAVHRDGAVLRLRLQCPQAVQRMDLCHRQQSRSRPHRRCE